MNSNKIVTAKQNMDNLDLMGATILGFAKRGIPIDPFVAAALSALVAECRVYSTFRDTELTDETSNIIRSEVDRLMKQQEKSNENSVSAAADEILSELRKSGINI